MNCVNIFFESSSAPPASAPEVTVKHNFAFFLYSLSERWPHRRLRRFHICLIRSVRKTAFRCLVFSSLASANLDAIRVRKKYALIYFACISASACFFLSSEYRSCIFSRFSRKTSHRF